MALRPFRLVTAAALAVLALASGGCGGQEPEGAASIDQSSWKPAFEGAMDALGRRDYRAFTALMTPLGRETLDNDLRGFSANLAHAMEGPRLLSHIRARWPEVPDALVVSARGGDLEAAWKLFLGASTPAGVRPRQAGMRLDPQNKDTMSLRYRYSEGDDLGLEMRRIRGRWFVDTIELRKTS